MRATLVSLAILISLTTGVAGESPLRAFDFLAGHCWRGEVGSGAVDTHCYTWVYGGKHLRDVHVVRGEAPDYCGESIYSVDGETGGVIFRYWNSLGGVSDGRIVVEEDALVAPGERYVGKDGVPREFRTRLRHLGEDRYEAATDELVGGDWSRVRDVEFHRIGPAGQPDCEL